MPKKKKYFGFIQRAFLSILLTALVSSCGIYKPSDARKVSPNPKERVKSNMEKGEGFRLKNITKKKGSFQFASSNEMWRATLDVLDFAPLSNVDYSGGIIITDWFNESSQPNNSLKITVRFLTNEIRADGIDVTLHKKICNKNLECTVKKYSSKINSEIKLAILKKATKISKMDEEKYLEENGEVRIINE